MRIATNGILVNQFNQILLIQRNDTRTFATPGGGVEAGELPPENIAREIQEETGIIALPVRLVSLNFWALPPQGFLSFTFRCMQRGGTLQTSPESPRVGFFATNPLPKPMLPVSRQRIERGLKHVGGPVEWWTVKHTAVMRLGRFFLFNVLYRWFDWKRKVQGRPVYQAPPAWEIIVHVVMQSKEGAVLWQKTADGWQLPGGRVPAMTAPWETAVTLTHQQTGLTPHLTDLSGVYIIEGSSQMTLVFTAVSDHDTPLASSQWRAVDVPATPSEAQHHYVANALTTDKLTTFALLPY